LFIENQNNTKDDDFPHLIASWNASLIDDLLQRIFYIGSLCCSIMSM